MSRTIETTSTPDLLIQAEPRTNGQRERDVCRKLANKIAVITGALTGMGLATAKRFVQEVCSDCAVSPRDRLALFPKRGGCFAAGVARQPSMTRLLKVGDNHGGAFTICP